VLNTGINAGNSRAHDEMRLPGTFRYSNVTLMQMKLQQWNCY